MLRIRNFQSALGSKAQIGVSNESKHAFVRVNGKDIGVIRRFVVANAMTCILLLNRVAGPEGWKLV